MAHTIHVRNIRIQELPRLLKFKSQNDYLSSVEERMQAEPLYKALLKRFWYGERLKILGAYDERGTLVGYVSIVFGQHRNSRGAAHIANIAVSDSARGKGVGTKILHEVEVLVRSKNVRRIELEVFSSNQNAVRLYERLGYETEGVKRKVIENDKGSDDLVLMAKLLEG